MRQFIILCVISMSLCWFQVGQALPIFDQKIVGEIQHNLQQALGSSKCIESAINISNMVNYYQFYKYAVPKNIQISASQSDQLSWRFFLKKSLRKTLTRFLCNKSLAKYHFFQMAKFPKRRQMVYCGGYTTNDKQYLALTMILTKAPKWGISNIAINTTYLDVAFKTQFKTILHQNKTKQLLDVLKNAAK